jgi:hypothetical protein
LFQVPPVLTVDTLIDKLDQLRHSIGQGQPVETDPQPADVQEPEAKKSIEPIPEAEHPVQETAAPAAPRTLDDKTLWDRLTERAAREKPSLAGILKKCRPGGIEGQRLNLEVGGTEFTLKSVKKHITLLEGICGEIAGHTLGLNLIPKIEDGGARQQAKKKDAQLKKKALSHPMVMETLELFDGKLVDIVLPQKKNPQK